MQSHNQLELDDHHKLTAILKVTINNIFYNYIFCSTSRTNMHPWRTNNLARDLHSDFDSMFSRSGATLPRGEYFK